jgi:Zinc-finger of C2H2 type
MQMERKKDQQKAKEAWRESAMREMEEAEEEDRLAGRIRLADLEDDYDYGGGKKKKGKKKKSTQSFVELDDSNGEDEAVAEASDTVAPLPPASTEIRDSTDVGDAVDSTVTIEACNAQYEVVSENDVEQSLRVQINLDGQSGCQHEDDLTDTEDEPDLWRCDCCRKDFKSEGQMVNHMKSKKHKEAFKKYQTMLKKQADETVAQIKETNELRV